jgi:hypothetical protein
VAAASLQRRERRLSAGHEMSNGRRPGPRAPGRLHADPILAAALRRISAAPR